MTEKSILADMIASYFFGKVVKAEFVRESDFGYVAPTENTAETQVSVFFADKKIYIETYLTYNDGTYAEPDFIIHGDNAQAVAQWIETEKRISAAD